MKRTTYRVTGMISGCVITAGYRTCPLVTTVNETIAAISPVSAVTAAYNRTVRKLDLVKAAWVESSVKVDELSGDGLVIEEMEQHEQKETA